MVKSFGCPVAAKRRPNAAIALSGVIPPEMPQTEIVVPDLTNITASSADISFLCMTLPFPSVCELKFDRAGLPGGLMRRKLVSVERYEKYLIHNPLS